MRSTKTHFCVAGKQARSSCVEQKTTRFGSIVAIGSGASTLVEEVVRVDGYSLSLTHAIDDPLYHAIINTLTLISQLHQIDTLTAKFLLEYWGGAFELIYHDGNELRFLDEYTIFFWHLDVTAESQQLDPLGVRKYQRGDEHSLVYCNQSGQFSFFGAADIDAGAVDPVTIDIRKVGFNSEIMINLVLATRNQRVQNIYNFMDKHVENYPGAVFIEVDEKANLSIFIQSKLGEELASRFSARDEKLE